MNTRLLLLAFCFTGCYTDTIAGGFTVGWRTELHTAFHNADGACRWSTVDTRASVERQIKANTECVDTLMDTRLPDSNLVWKQSRGMTGCLFSFHKSECVCEAPGGTGPREARWSTSPGHQTMWVKF